MIPTQLHGQRFILVDEKKHPIEPNWQKTANYQHNDNKLLAFLKNHQRYGVLCGGPNNLLVVDFDDAKFQEQYEQLLPETFTVKTARKGLHHLYYFSDDCASSKRLDDNKKTLCDIRGDRTQVIGPGTVVKGIGEYTIVKDTPIATIKRATLDAIIQPDNKKSAISTKPQTQSDGELANLKANIPILKVFHVLGYTAMKDGKNICPFHPDHSPSLQIYVNDNRFHCYGCNADGSSIDLIMHAKKCNTKDAIGYLKQIGYSIHKKIAPQKTHDDISREGDLLAHTERHISELKENITSAFIIDHDKGKATHLLSQYAMTILSIKTIEETDEIFVYNHGIYTPKGEKKIIALVQSLGYEKYITKHLLEEVLGHIRRETYVSITSLAETQDNICLKNGILNIKTGTITEHSPDYWFLNRLPVEHREGATCPTIRKFLSEVIPENKLLAVQEFIGYCLLKAHPIHRFFILEGEGKNGKSTFVNLLTTFLGKENVTSIPIQALENNRFAVSHLYGKLANTYADLSDKALDSTSIIKSITGGDALTAEKKFGQPFTFNSYAKHIFSCNRIPRSPDDSDAFFRRPAIIPFTRQFIKDADKHLLEKMTTDEELSGLLNWVVEGLKRLNDQEDFSGMDSIEETRELYVRLSDSVQAFINDCIETDPEELIPKATLYNLFRQYCQDKKQPVLNETAFLNSLRKKLPIADERPRIESVRKALARQGLDGLGGPTGPPLSPTYSKLDRVHCIKGIKVGKRIGTNNGPPGPPRPFSEYQLNYADKNNLDLLDRDLLDRPDQTQQQQNTIDKPLQDVVDPVDQLDLEDFDDIEQKNNFLTRPSDDMVLFVLEGGDGGCLKDLFVEKFGHDALSGLLYSGRICEYSPGVLHVVN